MQHEFPYYITTRKTARATCRSCQHQFVPGELKVRTEYIRKMQNVVLPPCEISLCLKMSCLQSPSESLKKKYEKWVRKAVTFDALSNYHRLWGRSEFLRAQRKYCQLLKVFSGFMNEVTNKGTMNIITALLDANNNFYFITSYSSYLVNLFKLGRGMSGRYPLIMLASECISLFHQNGTSIKVIPCSFEVSNVVVRLS